MHHHGAALSDHNFGKLVIAGSGQSRLRELTLASLTRHILQPMTVPAPMSH